MLEVECDYILCVWGLTKQQSMAFLPEPQGQGSPRPQHSTYCLPEPQGQAALSFSYMVCFIDGLMVRGFGSTTFSEFSVPDGRLEVNVT